MRNKTSINTVPIEIRRHHSMTSFEHDFCVKIDFSPPAQNEYVCLAGKNKHT